MTLGEAFEVIAADTLSAGGAKQLIRVLTGKEYYPAGRSTELGVQCFNVATAYTAWRRRPWRPMIARRHADRQRRTSAQLGSIDRDAAQRICRPRTAEADATAYLMGGPMMGFEMPAMDAPLVGPPTASSPRRRRCSPPPRPEMPHPLRRMRQRPARTNCSPSSCTGFCGNRNSARRRIPHLRLHQIRLLQFRLPSRIPLVQCSRFAKSEIWAREREGRMPPTRRRPA